MFEVPLALKILELVSRSFGDRGAPVAILHGLFGSGRNWHTVARRTAINHRVLVPDLRNHGASPHSKAMDYPHVAADILALLDRYRIDRTALVGHSFGGKTAMWLALTEPARVERLVVVDIAPVRYETGFEAIADAMRKLPLAAIKTRKDADDHLAATIKESSLRQFLLQNLIGKQDEYRWRVNLDILSAVMPGLGDFPLSPDTIPYDGKTLFIGGSDSPYIKREHHQTIFQWFPKARIEMVPNAGHWVQAQQPEAFHDLVERFLKS